MIDPLSLQDRSERLFPLQDEPSCLGRKTVQKYLDGGIDRRPFAVLDVKDNLPRYHVVGDDPLQYPQAHGSLPGVGEGRGQIAVVNQQTPVRLGNIAPFHADDLGQRRAGRFVKLAHRKEQVGVGVH